MHFHRCEQEILINVEIDSVVRIKVRIAVDNVTSELSLSALIIRIVNA